jgi:hypothetical protein
MFINAVLAITRGKHPYPNNKAIAFIIFAFK